MSNKKCHFFEQKAQKYFCKYCGIESKTAELQALRTYKNGLLYAYPKDNMVGGWADKLVNATFGNEWVSNMGDKRQSVYFSFEGKKYYGIYFKTNSDIVRYRMLK